MLYEIFEYVVKDGEVSMEEMPFGTIEDKYIDALSKYLTEKCGYIEDEPRKFSLRVISEANGGNGKPVFHEWVRHITIDKLTEKGSIEPDNFDQIELPIGDPWSNIDVDLYHKVADGFWVVNTYDKV